MNKRIIFFVLLINSLLGQSKIYGNKWSKVPSGSNRPKGSSYAGKNKRKNDDDDDYGYGDSIEDYQRQQEELNEVQRIQNQIQQNYLNRRNQIATRNNYLNNLRRSIVRASEDRSKIHI